MEMKHTPTPWKLVGANQRTICEANGPNLTHPVAEIFGGQSASIEEANSNAAFIVRACNSHEALVALLAEAAEALGYLNEFYDEKTGGAVTPKGESPEQLADRIEAALKLAKP